VLVLPSDYPWGALFRLSFSLLSARDVDIPGSDFFTIFDSFHLLVIPFGLADEPAVFMEFMSMVFRSFFS
jgi:hypothetical protein